MLKGGAVSVQFGLNSCLYLIIWSENKVLKLYNSVYNNVVILVFG